MMKKRAQTMHHFVAALGIFPLLLVTALSIGTAFARESETIYDIADQFIIEVARIYREFDQSGVSRLVEKARYLIDLDEKSDAHISNLLLAFDEFFARKDYSYFIENMDEVFTLNLTPLGREVVSGLITASYDGIKEPIDGLRYLCSHYSEQDTAAEALMLRFAAHIRSIRLEQGVLRGKSILGSIREEGCSHRELSEVWLYIPRGKLEYLRDRVFLNHESFYINEIDAQHLERVQNEFGYESYLDYAYYFSHDFVSLISLFPDSWLVDLVLSNASGVNELFDVSKHLGDIYALEINQEIDNRVSTVTEHIRSCQSNVEFSSEFEAILKNTSGYREKVLLIRGALRAVVRVCPDEYLVSVLKHLIRYEYHSLETNATIAAMVDIFMWIVEWHLSDKRIGCGD